MALLLLSLIVGTLASTLSNCACQHGVCMPSLEDSTVESCFCHAGYYGKTCAEGGSASLAVKSHHMNPADAAILTKAETVAGALSQDVKIMEARAVSVNETLGLSHAEPPKEQPNSHHILSSSEVINFLRAKVSQPTAPGAASHGHGLCLLMAGLMICFLVPCMLSLSKNYGSPKYTGLSVVVWIAGFVYCISSGVLQAFAQGDSLGWQCTIIVIVCAVHSVLMMVYCGLTVMGRQSETLLPAFLMQEKAAMDKRLSDELMQCLLHGKHPHQLHFDSPDWKSACEGAFKEADSNGNGQLDVRELLEGGYASSTEEAQQVMTAYDKDGSHTLSLAEFSVLMEMAYLRKRGYGIDTPSQPPTQAPTPQGDLAFVV